LPADSVNQSGITISEKFIHKTFVAPIKYTVSLKLEGEDLYASLLIF